MIGEKSEQRTYKSNKKKLEITIGGLSLSLSISLQYNDASLFVSHVSGGVDFFFLRMHTIFSLWTANNVRLLGSG